MFFYAGKQVFRQPENIDFDDICEQHKRPTNTTKRKTKTCRNLKAWVRRQDAAFCQSKETVFQAA